jgi:lysophospholipase L1-like esterase
MRHIKWVIFNVFCVTLPSITVFFLICELIIFRWIVPAAQVPYHIFDTNWLLLKHDPYSGDPSGVYRKGITSEIQGRYRINQAGWNSIHEYVEKKENTTRIAVIGDSYVQALQVNVEDAFPNIIEKTLVTEGVSAEVYSFGISGAPLSQYLQIMRYVASSYRPDIVIVNIAHNDIDESLEGRTTAYFLRFRETPAHQYVHLVPSPYEPNWVRRVMGYSAVVRFLAVQMALQERLATLRRMFRQDAVQQNVKVSGLLPEERLRGITRHVFMEYKQLADQYRFRLLLVIDTPRHFVYQHQDPRKVSLYRLNEIVYSAAHDIELPMIDMTDYFIKDYRKHHMRFEFRNDGHWNTTGHRVVGKTIAHHLIVQGWVPTRDALQTTPVPWL